MEDGTVASEAFRAKALRANVYHARRQIHEENQSTVVPIYLGGVIFIQGEMKRQ